MLERAALETEGVRKDPAPHVFVSDAAESWVTLTLIYFLDDYAQQWNVTDRLLQRALPELERGGVRLAPPRIQVLQ
jgi:small-conductance mechanosensitive channel